MKILGKQFVFGRTIDEAMKRATPERRQGLTHSFDMLGEAARTHADAARYAKATLGCTYFSFLTAIDWKADGLEIVVWVDNLDAKLSVQLRTRLGAGHTTCASIVLKCIASIVRTRASSARTAQVC